MIRIFDKNGIIYEDVPLSDLASYIATYVNEELTRGSCLAWDGGEPHLHEQVIVDAVDAYEGGAFVR